MAVAQSTIFNMIRGSLGDITFAGGHSNRIVVRSKIVSPAYPDTAGQQAAKAAFTWSLQQWASISQAYRDGWSDYGKTILTRKPFADSNLTGRQAFVQSISLARFLNQLFGDPASVTFEPPEEPGYISSCVTTVLPYDAGGAAGIKIHYENFTDNWVLAYNLRSDPFPATRNKLRSPFLYSTGQYRPVNISSTSDDYFHTTVGNIGKVFFVKHSFLSRYAPFRTGVRLITRHVIAAP